MTRKKQPGRQNASNQKVGSSETTFKPYISMPLKSGWHRHHIGLAAILRRARSRALRELQDEMGAEYVSPQTHQRMHTVVNNALKRAGLYPGAKRSFSEAEVKRALRVLIDTYRTEGVSDYADYLEGFLGALRNARML